MSGAAAPSLQSTDAERFLRAVRAQLRQEFAAPAASIVGYAEMLVEDTGRLGLDVMRPDLDRVLTAGQALQRLIGDILARDAGTDDEETRQKVLGVTLGWAALNLLALARDRRALKKAAKKA